MLTQQNIDSALSPSLLGEGNNFLFSPIYPNSEDLSRVLESTLEQQAAINNTSQNMEQSFAHLLKDQPDEIGLFEFGQIDSPLSTQKAAQQFFGNTQQKITVQQPKTENHFPTLLQPQITTVKLIEEEKLQNQIEKKKKQVKIKSEKKKKRKMTAEVSGENLWKMVQLHEKFIKSASVNIKTRTEIPSPAMPDRVFSSLKYTLMFKVELGLEYPTDATFVLTRVFIVNSGSFKKVVKIRDPLKGQTEVALTRNSSMSILEGKVQLQFGDLSYHKEQQTYCLEVHFFTPSNTSQPIAVTRSSPFRVYARKPNKRNYGGSKRKREELDEAPKIEEAPEIKKKKNSEFDVFIKKLDGLLELKDRLSREEQMFAIQLVMSKFRQIDPNVGMNMNTFSSPSQLLNINSNTDDFFVD